MSALAMFYKAAGYSVSGSDIAEGAYTKALREHGVNVATGHSASNIDGCGLVVKNAAISADNPEVRAAREQGITVKERAEILGETASRYNKCIAVSGAHGKTTCGGMLSNIFLEAKLDPSVHIGGTMLNLGSQYRVGGGEYFITEACEYKRSFLHIAPDTAVVLNVAMDHPDCYKDIDDVGEAFARFLRLVKRGGAAVLNGDDKYLAALSKTLSCQTVFFGLNKGNAYRASDISHEKGRYAFDLREKGNRLCRVRLKVLGRHNIYNALAAAAAARLYGIPVQAVKDGLESFAGMRRRFEYWGNLDGAEVYHDYAHHPQEITATLKAAAPLLTSPQSRLICVFQPHTYTRTQKLFDKFVESLEQAGIIILAAIYPAREPPIPGVTSEALKTALELRGKEAYLCPDFKGLAEKIKEIAKYGDVVLVLGAGDVETLKEFLF